MCRKGKVRVDSHWRMAMPDVVPIVLDDSEAQQIIDALFAHQRMKGIYSNGVIGALSVAISAFGELEPGSIIGEEDYDLSCKYLLEYAMVLSRNEDEETWENNLKKSAELAILIFGEERAAAISQIVSDEYDEMDLQLQEELDRPPRSELN